MKQIRIGVFETNSSSTHSITMCSEDKYSKWVNGELLKFSDGFVTREQAIEELKSKEYSKFNNPDFDFSNKKAVDKELQGWEYFTYEQYFNSDYLESFIESYTTKHGEKIIAFGLYGQDN